MQISSRRAHYWRHILPRLEEELDELTYLQEELGDDLHWKDDNLIGRLTFRIGKGRKLIERYENQKLYSVPISDWETYGIENLIDDLEEEAEGLETEA